MDSLGLKISNEHVNRKSFRKILLRPQAGMLSSSVRGKKLFRNFAGARNVDDKVALATLGFETDCWCLDLIKSLKRCACLCAWAVRYLQRAFLSSQGYGDCRSS
jgi:hypothetical protein